MRFDVVITCGDGSEVTVRPDFDTHEQAHGFVDGLSGFRAVVVPVLETGDACPTCAGDGRVCNGDREVACGDCEGEGTVTLPSAAPKCHACGSAIDEQPPF